MSKKRCLIMVGIVMVMVALLAILHNTILANHRPVITSLTAEREKVIPSGSCQIICTATDSDGDNLSYGWSASGGVIVGEGATVTWTAPSSQGLFDVAVTVTDGHSGEVMSQVTITVSANRPPYVTKLIANADWTTPSGTLQVICDASDPNNDELNYEWSSTAGNISGTGMIVNWISPQEVGIYHVTVVVNDGHGEEVTKSVILSVALDPPPVVEDLIVTAKGHRYLRKSTFGYDYDVWKTAEYDIDCVVSNTSSAVFYEWSCTGGQVSGGNSMITWTAPNDTSIEVTVTVVVSDIADNKVGKSIDFYVPFCACGF
jgi:hypothetical protein